MKLTFSRCLMALLFSIAANLLLASGDSNVVFKKIYTKKEWKKEVKDFKGFNKEIKSIKKVFASGNIDAKNAALTNLKDLMKKEYDELNIRITARAKKFSPAKRSNDTLIRDDIPKGYNPTIKGQIERVDKASILDGKSETEILVRYSKILNKENKVIRQLSMMDEITEATPIQSIEEILKNADEFKSYLKDEINLMAKEQGKK